MTGDSGPPDAQRQVRGLAMRSQWPPAGPPLVDEAPRMPLAVASDGGLTGRIIMAETPMSESAAPDIAARICRVLWLTVALILPIWLLFHLLAFGGGAGLLLIALIVAAVWFVSPANILHLLLLLGCMRRSAAPAAEQVPVRYFRVRGLDGEAEWMVRMKGTYMDGSIASDDLVTFHGYWRRGVYRARSAFNHRTHSWVRLRRSQSWVALLVTLGVVAFILISLAAHCQQSVEDLGRVEVMP